MRVGELAQKLRALAAASDILGFSPNTHVTQLFIPVISWKGSVTPSSGLHKHHRGHDAQIRKQTKH